MKELYALLAIVVILIIAGIINDTNRTLVMSIGLSTLMLTALVYLITSGDSSTPLPPKVDDIAVQYGPPPVQKPTFPQTVGPTVDPLKAMKRKDIRKALESVDAIPILSDSEPPSKYPKIKSTKTHGIAKKAIFAGTMLGSAQVAGGPTLTIQNQPKFEVTRGVAPEGIDPKFGFTEGQSLLYYSPVQFPIATDNPAGEELANKLLFKAKYKYHDDDEPPPLLPQQEKQEQGYFANFFSNLRTCA